MRAYLLSKDTAGITIAITLVLAMMVPTVLARTQNVLPNGGKCMGFKTSPTYCKFIEMPNGSVILNVNWTIGAYTIDANELYAGDPYVGSTDQIPRTETQTQPVSSDSNNDNDDGGGNTEDEGQDVKDAQSGFLISE